MHPHQPNILCRPCQSFKKVSHTRLVNPVIASLRLALSQKPKLNNVEKRTIVTARDVPRMRT